MARTISTYLLSALFPLMLLAATPSFGEETFITLVYHDIPDTITEKDDISRKDFINQIEYLRSHGYTFVSQTDILNAAKNGGSLPNKSVLLTFDDAYLSFHQFVYPLLRLYNIPAILSVVTSWIDNSDRFAYKTKHFMTWQQLKEISDSKLVTIASHSSGLHLLERSNPAGNLEPAPSTFLYLPGQDRYETEAEFRKRISSDLSRSIDSLREKLGQKPVVLTWPYGSYNLIGIEEAKKLGFEMILTLDAGYSNIRNLDKMQRHYMSNQSDWLTTFKDSLALGLHDNIRTRGVQVDLDMIVNRNSPEESDRNLGLMIDRLVQLGVNTVFLQGFSDPNGTGNVKSLFFANSVLPFDADFLSHAVNRIQSRGIRVFVWMPVLAFELPNSDINESLKVREWKNGKAEITSSWYRRLSPFDPRTLEQTRKIFRDLASFVNFDGILIQDDAYLASTEDFHPAAVEAFHKQYGVAPYPEIQKTDRSLAAKWAKFKQEGLDRYIGELVTTVKSYRPAALIARNIYGMPVTNPESMEWFAQDLQSYLHNYDLTVVMAYARMEGKDDSLKWYRELFRAAGGKENSTRMLFKLQSFDWKKMEWISDEALRDEMAFMLALGVRHIAYYPDNVFQNRPDMDTISSIISSKNEVKLTSQPASGRTEGFFERLFRRLFPRNP